jgi:alkanesulfonate monooxygenase SsuD/methylene tetrahydromethanopterin reductase-like flavin-dependent oxidoreductase (luciferase family)
MKLSCAFATSVDTPDHVAVAESLGYRRAWLYDSPAIYPDVWMALALAADRTSTIGVGPGVLIPSLRHPMVNAGAIAALEALAPGRVAIGVGAGFTGRYTMGQKPLRWADVGRYVEVLRALLRGDVIEWEGAAVKMLHGRGFGAERPIDVPIFIGAGGPVGTEVALRVGDGIMAAGAPNTVAPAGTEHLATHEGHLVRLAAIDEAAITEAADLIPAMSFSGTAGHLSDRVRGLAAAGVTEIAYQPAGPDIPGELERMADALDSVID